MSFGRECGARMLRTRVVEVWVMEKRGVIILEWQVEERRRRTAYSGEPMGVGLCVVAWLWTASSSVGSCCTYK